MSKIKYRNEQKLHISKSPDLQSWCVVIVCSTIGLIIAVVICNNLIRFFCASLGTLIGFSLLEKWEDCVLDQQLDRIIVTQSNWIHQIFCCFPQSNTIILPLKDVTTVSATISKGLQLHFRNREPLTILSSSKNIPIKDLRHLKQEVSSFLHLERIETVPDHWNWGYSFDTADEIVEMLTPEEMVDVQLQNAESEKSAHVGCRNAIKIIVAHNRRQRD